MSAKLIQAETGFPVTAKAVVLYDELNTLLAANQFMDHLPSQTNNDVEWEVNSWQFDMLRLGCTLEAYRALEDSADAALVLVAIQFPSTSAHLPAAWLEHWALRRQHRDARLMAMSFDPSGKLVEFEPLSGKLRRIAESYNLSFSIFNNARYSTNAAGISKTRRIVTLHPA